jgi:hypothetical protein
MKTMTLLAALALVGLVSGSTPALAVGMPQTPEYGATYSNCATPTPPAQRIADAGPTISLMHSRLAATAPVAMSPIVSVRIWSRSKRKLG